MPDAIDRLAYWLIKDINRAIYEYGMIADGDRVAVAVSGGKDSLSLLRLLDIRRQSVPEKYELLAVHVIGDSNGPDQPLHPPLIEWLESNHYPYVTAPLMLSGKDKLPLSCHRCTWNRRRVLFEVAHQNGCNVVAFGHHADDLAQTTLLNVLFHGRAETMEPRREYFGGLLRLVRPMCYLPEQDIRRFSMASQLPVPPPQCPQSGHSRRRLVADWLRQIERDCKDARTNLIHSGLTTPTDRSEKRTK